MSGRGRAGERGAWKEGAGEVMPLTDAEFAALASDANKWIEHRGRMNTPPPCQNEMFV